MMLVQPGLRPQAGTRDSAVPRVAKHMDVQERSEEHTSELQSLMRISYAVFCLKKKTKRRAKMHYPTHRKRTSINSMKSNVTATIYNRHTCRHISMNATSYT